MTPMANAVRSLAPALAATALLLAMLVLPVFDVPRSAAATGKSVPAPLLDEPAAQAASATIVLAGGCFWGVQGVYQHVQGVMSAVSGYAGGQKDTASYEEVSSGATGHAEAVRITYDPRRISSGRLLQIFFAVVHDPTQRNRQGPDIGTQYRSAIFTADPEQARIARAYIAQLDAAGVFGAAVATTVEPGHAFYPAETYHQDFMAKHPHHPYIVFHDRAKVSDLQQQFPDLYRADPVLVSSSGSTQ
ncbi:MAG TPA: peptide-methionine (S)-S-oxide reductase MsrA [Hyphomicrobiaceae bacterium]|nr:peptide-methionine (S)-S-oxide reductase MsrA [Hyphomicrobiaceae bacterium]